MDFLLLGPVTVLRDGTPIELGRRRERLLLGLLLLEPGRAVPASRLVGLLWDGDPPPSAPASLRTHVARLRARLAPCPVRLMGVAGGYLAEVDPQDVDVHVFRTRVEMAQRAQAPAERAALLREALALWRGPLMADAADDHLRERIGASLTELFMSATEACAEADLANGSTSTVIAALPEFTRAYPLREQAVGLLMTALYRAGRQADALTLYQSTRTTLVEDLGVEPGPELRRLHEQILRNDPALARGMSQGIAAPDGDRPRFLPRDPPDFTGRASELTMLDSFAGTADAPATGVIAAISGPGGVGKTALAVHWGHLHADRFPCGQLYLNLRGYDPGQPMTALESITTLLRALGVPADQVPVEEQQAAGMYRSLIAGRRMLVLLDNAVSAEQVRPLLPGGPASLVLVTSRDRLAGLVARDAARRLLLDMLSEAEATGLLARVAGAQRVRAEPAAAAALVALCGHLPLAIRVAAELAVARPAAALTELATDLADEDRRLDMLDAGGDTHTAARTVLSWSYRQLTPDAARAFRMIGLHPGREIRPAALAALMDSDPEAARRLAGVLEHAHLIGATSDGGYGLHDLVRIYAAECAREEPAEAARAALTRVLDYYLDTASAAANTLAPDEARPAAGRLRASTVPDVADPARATEWLEAVRPVLVAATAHAARHGWPAHAVRLAGALALWLYSAAHYPDSIAVHGHAAEAARSLGDRSGEARSLRQLGIVRWRQGHLDDALSHLERALTFFREAGDRRGEADTLNNLGGVCIRWARHDEALDYLGQAIAGYHAIGYQLGEARTHSNVGVVNWQLGRYRQAEQEYQRALALFREIDHQAGTGSVLGNLGNVHHRLGRYQQAREYHAQALASFRDSGQRADEAEALSDLGLALLRLGQPGRALPRLAEALTLSREIGDRAAEAAALDSLGEMYRMRRQFTEAIEHFQQSLSIAREMGDRLREASALNGLGETHLAMGANSGALTHHERAAALAGQSNDQYQEARALDGAGHAEHANGDFAAARRHWAAALDIYTALGVPEAHSARRSLRG